MTQSSWPSSSDGSRSSAVSACSQRSSTCAPISSPPHASRPVSSAYLRASRRNSHCTSIAVQRPSDATSIVARHVGSCETVRIAGTGPADREVLVDEAVFDHREHDRGRADLQERRDLAQVRVADDHVQPAVLLRIGVRLVARVDDRALQRRLEPDLLLEEVGALADLEVDGFGAVLGADLARAGEHLPRDEPRDEVAHERRERHRAVDEEVLVAAVRVALAVAVVLVDDDLLAGGQQLAGRVHRAGEDALPRLVEEHGLHRVAALGRGVLGVRVVDVVAGAVREHRVDEMRLDLGRLRAVAGEPARVAARRLVFEVPADAVLLDVAVDQEARRDDRVRVRARRAARRRTRSRCRRSSGRPRGQSTGGPAPVRPAATASRAALAGTCAAFERLLRSPRTAARRAGTTASRPRPRASTNATITSGNPDHRRHRIDTDRPRDARAAGSGSARGRG